jgi:ice-binding like protein
VYKASAALGLTGTVTLDGQNDPNAVFIFQAGSTLITASDATVALIRGAQACNVFWQVGSSATLGTTTTFVGTIMALTSVSVQTGTTVQGRVLARNGQVTLDTNVITRPTCTLPPPITTTTPPTTTTTVAASDFAISVQPPSASVTPGSSTTPTVQTTVTSGSAGTVTLSATGLPPGATVSFQPPSVIAGHPTIVTISTTASTPPGRYPITITGTEGSRTHTTTFVLTVTAAAAGGGGGPSEVIPVGHPQTGAGGTAASANPGLMALAGLALAGAGVMLGHATRRDASGTAHTSRAGND